ncbi:GPP34 family phosphoprotein [Arthrobacter sp. B3I4]|uniref:GOLPH3/VPS74 family protein n=1 Tax=Arthrobacter sp. B3I4 TaxID=3042267 RepID=UPI0027D7E379|nr:GPP34 family phosphoprotein [Arthrobacter sp. B3I4]
MDPETPKAAELSLPQAFLLLATNDQDGKPAVPVFALRTALAGAVLAELELCGAIELQGKRVRVTDSPASTSVEHELELIRGKSRPHSPKRWVSMLEGKAEVQRVYDGMVARGLVEQIGEKHLGVFRSIRYPEKDHGPEAALLQKIGAALSTVLPASAEPAPGGSDVPSPDVPAAPGAAPAAAEAPDARTTALIALLQAAGLLGKLFPAVDKVRADELAKDYWPARAVEDELRLIRLAKEEAPAV